MKKITLFCCAGMSTSMLVQKMDAAAKAQGKDYNINAYSLTELEQQGKGSDVILLGPQVRYALKSVQDRYPQIPVASIDMRAYGMMDGKAVLKIAEDKMK